MFLAVTVVDASGEAVDCLVDCDDAATVADFLAVAWPGASHDQRITVGGRVLRPTDPVAGSGIVDGAVVVLGAPPARRGRAEGSVRLAVTGGEGAGTAHRLDVGAITVGSGAGADVRMDWLPEHAFTLHVEIGGGVRVGPGRGEEAVLVGGAELSTEIPLLPGMAIAVSGSVMEATAVRRERLPVTASTDPAGRDMYRPPRILPAEPQHTFTLPKHPTKPRQRGLHIAMLAAPLVVAAVMVVALGSWHYALFALLSPIMMVGSWFATRQGAKSSYAAEVKEFQETTARITADVDDAVRLEQAARRHMAPDPAELGLIATTPTRRVWERRHDDPDFLTLRIGTADGPSKITVEDPNADAHRRKTSPVASAIPVTVSLPQRGVVGVYGHPDRAGDMATWMVAQIAALHSPKDVSLYVVCTPDRAHRWQWARWLPSVKPTLGQPTVATVAVDADAAAARVGELVQVVTERMAYLADNAGAQPMPLIVVVLDASRALRRTSGMAQVLRDGPEVGVYAICVDHHVHHLPEETNAVVGVDDVGRVTLRQQREDAVVDALADRVPSAWYPPVARALAPLRDTGDEEGGGLPDAVQLVDVAGMPSPSVQDVLGRWASSGRSTAAVVGATRDGPLVVDIVRDGPHALVAGTTGSGKSELLQTWVASLAANNRPDEFCFVLVDYKGGSAFAECADLPHTVGLVTDLDEHLVQRCLVSLRSELTYREELLARYGVANIDAYVHLRDSDTAAESMPPLPRLMLVIDEFAALAQELPDFLAGLIDFAQRGRSLGMHLVLATQRPAGVVSGPIRANTNLRICLRVTSTAESADVIDAPDAAMISPSTPGRGVIRRGPAAVQPFQTARIAGRVRGAAQKRPSWAGPFDAASAGRARPPVQAAPTREGDDRTDLSVLVAVISQTASALAVTKPRRPWLPPLPSAVTLDTLHTGEVTEPAAWGLADYPREQRQGPIGTDLAGFSHRFVVGAARSGRTQALRTMVAALAVEHPTSDLHVYGLDCGNGGLACLERLPQCGVVVPRGSADRVRVLVNKLTAMIVDRGQVLSRHGVGSVAELRDALPTGHADRLPYVVVALDRWEGWTATFADVDAGAVHGQLMAVLSDGPSVGIHALITGDRHLSTGRMMSLTDDRLILRLNEKTDYGLVGVPAKLVPHEMPDGRALAVGEGTEIQVALLAEDPSASAAVAAIHDMGERLSARDAAVPAARWPWRLRVLPEALSVQELCGADGYVPAPMRAWCGVGGENVEAMGPDLSTHAVFTVAGPQQSGRSTILVTMAESLLAGGTRLVVVAPRESALRGFAGREGVVEVVTDAEFTGNQLDRHLCPGTVLLIDDGDLLKSAPCAPWLKDTVRGARDAGIGVVVGGLASELATGLSGWPVEVRRARRGILTAAATLMDGDAVGVRLTRSMLVDTPTLGRATYHDGSGSTTSLAYPKI